MASTMHGQPSVRSAADSWAARIFVPEMWGTLAIAVMWLPVLFVGVYGGEATFHSVDSSVTTIPAGVLVALFAAIGTASVARRAFGRKPG